MFALNNRVFAATAAVAASFATLAIGTAPAYAQTAETVDVAVRYGDLDLSTAKGAATLDRRIARAAETICGPSSRINQFEVANCRRAIVASAQKDVRLAQAKQSSTVLAAR